MSQISYDTLRQMLAERRGYKRLIARIARVHPGAVSRASNDKGKYPPSDELQRRLFRACVCVDEINDTREAMIEEFTEPDPMPRGPSMTSRERMKR